MVTGKKFYFKIDARFSTSMPLSGGRAGHVDRQQQQRIERCGHKPRLPRVLEFQQWCELVHLNLTVF